MDASHSTLAITYKDDGNQDGICSQLLRIYGIYAISRFLGVPYVHTPIAHLGYHGLAALEDNTPSPDLLERVNRAFQLPSDITPSKDQVRTQDMIDVDLEALRQMKNAERRPGVDLVRILYPFPATDIDPELFRYLKSVCPFPYRRSKVFRLAIHVRRGECCAVAQDWLLPNSHYVSCALRFQKALRQLDIPFVCELYTEVPTKAFEVTPQHHGIGGRIAENVRFDPAMNQIEDFDPIPHLERYINVDPIESLERLTTADALIISRSSFSYLPAVLNSDAIVIYNPYWRGRMKHWLVAQEDGVFPESQLVERLKRWKRTPPAHSMSVDSLSMGPSPIDRLLQPFREQSVTIRSIVALGCCEGSSFQTLHDGDAESGLPSILRVEPQRSTDFIRNRLCNASRGLVEESSGDDLLLLPCDLMQQALTSFSELSVCRALAVLFPDPYHQPGDSRWKLRRSLFDRGLICIGSAELVEGTVLCFLASRAVQCFDHLDVKSRGHISMKSFVEGAGFANQLWRYAFLKLFAMRHGLTPALPAWQGNDLFGLSDESCDGLNFETTGYPGFADNDRELWYQEDPPINIDLEGFFQEFPECWRKHRNLLRRMFELSADYRRAIEQWRRDVTEGGRRTLVAVSLRRGDYYKMQTETLPWFRIVPEEWYLDWLQTIWPTLSDPVLFVASDEPDRVTPFFEDFRPITTPFGGAAAEVPHHISDFEALRQADYLAICNSSFPRMAAILARDTQRCFLPSFQTRSFQPYEPWMDPAFWPRFADAWRVEQPPASPVILAAGQYVPITRRETSLAEMFVSGWRAVEATGIRPFGPHATLRFRVDAQPGSTINLVLKLSVTSPRVCLQLTSASGANQEVEIPQGPNRVALLTPTVEAGNMVTASVRTLNGGSGGALYEAQWTLKGLLYFSASGPKPDSRSSS